MAYRADEVKVGLVIVVSLLILAGFIISIMGLKLGEPMDTYTTQLKFAGGVEPGTVVRFGGMQVGKVTEVDISPSDDTRIRLAMIVEKGLPVKTDSEVFINTIGFLGDYYLEISTGSPGLPLLPPGGEINGMEIAGINEMFASAQSALNKVDAAMVILNERILTEDFGKLRNRIELITDKIVQLRRWRSSGRSCRKTGKTCARPSKIFGRLPKGSNRWPLPLTNSRARTAKTSIF